MHDMWEASAVGGRSAQQPYTVRMADYLLVIDEGSLVVEFQMPHHRSMPVVNANHVSTPGPIVPTCAARIQARIYVRTSARCLSLNCIA